MTEQQQRPDYQRAGQPQPSAADRPGAEQPSGYGPETRWPAPVNGADTDQRAGEDAGQPYGSRTSTLPPDEPAGGFRDERAGDLQRGPDAGTRGAGPVGTATGNGAPPATDRGLTDQATGVPGGRPGMDGFLERWASVQGAFVDDPKNAVGEADRLVGEVIQNLERSLTEQREQMQGEWMGGEPDTEQLRRLLHEYRALFRRLVESGF
jgi:hypothetical protein